jgi:hypothetical protein
MSLTAGQIPIVANVLNGGVAAMAASSNVVTLGSNTNGLAVYTAGTAFQERGSLAAGTEWRPGFSGVATPHRCQRLQG